MVAGVSTSGCVRATAMDALNAGFRPQVVRDACADRTPALHENNLADLDAKYADVVDLRRGPRPPLRGHFGQNGPGKGGGVRTSAGILLYRVRPGGVEVLLGHMGGPFWAKKDDGAWSIPKGEYGPGEDAFAVARREFEEELGTPVPGGRLRAPR